MLQVQALDTHSIQIEAGAETVWEALAATLVAKLSRPSARLVGALTDVSQSGGFEGPPFPEMGAEVPGFRVVVSTHGKRLRLEGRHRFSRYALDFELVATGTGTELSATTYATFPGRSGAIYKSLLLWTRGHVFVVKSLLRAVRRHAERSPAR